MLDFDFVNKVLTSILALIEEQDWNVDKVPVKVCCEVLEDLYPK